MGLTAHMALAFEPADEARVIAMLNGEDGAGDRGAIRLKPAFKLSREDHFEVHRFLETLAVGHPEIAGLGTIVIGVRKVAEVGMGVQYAHSADQVKRLADHYDAVSHATLEAAIAQIEPEFAGQNDHGLAPISRWMPDKFANIKTQLRKIADGQLAMIAGMC